MRKITKIRRSVRAVSPVISVLLMIAIAVAAALVAFAWVSGYLDFTTTKVEKSIQIQSVSQTAAYVQNVGEGGVKLGSMYVNGVLATDAVFAPTTLEPSESSAVTTAAFSWSDYSQVTIKIVTTEGISAQSAQYTKTFTSTTGTPQNPAVLDHFSFSFITSPKTSGVPFSVTIRAIDQYGATFTGYTGINDLTYSGGPIAPTTTDAFVSGVWSGSVTVTGEGTGVTLGTASQAYPSITGTSNAFNVEAPAAPALDHFVFDTISSPQTSGTAFTVTITALDQYGATFTSYTGINDLSYSDGTIAPTATAAFVDGVWSGSVTVTGEGTGVTLGTASQSYPSITGTSNAFNVEAPAAPALDHFVFDTVSSPQTSGDAFGITITAVDQYGATFTSYTGINDLSYSGGTINPTATAGFTDGVWTGSVTVTGAGTGVTIDTASQAYPSITGTSNTFNVDLPAPALDHFVFDTISSPQTSGTAFTVTITAIDQYGATFTTYTGINDLTYSGGPIAPTTTAAFVDGVWSGSVTVAGAGTGVTIGTSAQSASATGVSNTFDVNLPPPALDHFVFDTISSPQTSGDAFGITITAVDQYGATFTGYTGINDLSYSGGTINPTATAGFTDGVWTGSVTVTGAGTGVTIDTASQSYPSITGTSNTFNVEAPAPQTMILRPTGDTWTRELSDSWSGHTNWECVAEDDNDHYVYTNNDHSRRDIYYTADPTGGSGTINSVTIYIVAQESSSSGYARTVLLISNPDWPYNPYEAQGSTISLSHSWTTYNTEYTLNPRTSSAWTWQEITDLQIGVDLWNSGGYHDYAKCSQVWIVVTYTP
jgi:FlaG/FlaF family flagellin (archaellin)